MLQRESERMRFSLTFALAALLALGACEPSTDSEPIPSWQEFMPEDGGFSVLLPGTPGRETQSDASSFGAIDTIRFELAREGDPLSYEVQYTDMPPAILGLLRGVHTLLVARQRKLAYDLDATLLGEVESIVLDEYQGQHFKLELPDGSVGTYRIFYVDHRLYQLSVWTHADGAGAEQVSRFLGSFKLSGSSDPVAG
jgi:hypothetical protein